MAENPYFGGFEKALDRAIPLVIQSRRLDALKRQFNQNYELEVAQLMQDAEQAKMDIAADRMKELGSQVSGLIEQAYKAGDANTLQQLAPIANQLGMPIPSQGAPQQTESFGDPYIGPLGNLLQKSSTGKVQKIGTPARGMMIESSPEGGFTVRTGVPTGGGGQMTTSTRGQIEKQQIASSEGLARISQIVENYRPEWQEIPTRAGLAWGSIKDKFGVNISEEDRQKLEEFSRYRQDALGNINLYIRDITGAQMSEKEADRLRKAQPDPGEGIFDGDSPSVFKSKLINQYKRLKAANARYTMYKNQGIDENTIKNMVERGQVISLDEMEQIINERGKELQQQLQLQNPNMNAGQIVEQVKARLAQEFGLE